MAASGPPTPELRIDLLGSVRVSLGEQAVVLGPPRRQAVLAVLALRANQTVSRDEIVDAVWGENPPASAVNGVHVHIAALRNLLEPGREHRRAARLLSTSGGGYRLLVSDGELDVRVFDHHLRRGDALLAGGEPGVAVEAFDAGLGLWRGTPLAGVPGRLAETERVRLTEVRVAAREARAEALLRLGHDATLIAELFALAAEHPLRERIRALLMIALYRSGRPGEALAVFAESRRQLVDELGIEPGPELQRVHHQVLTGQQIDPSVRSRPRAEGDGAPPYAVPRQLPTAVRHFAGRARELKLLNALADEAETSGSAVVISAIGGMPGVGKTALTVHWAHQVADRFRDGQLYVNLRGFDPSGPPMQPADVMRRFLDALRVPAQQVPVGLDAQAALYRSLLADRRMLIVLDNARTVDQVRPLLPGAPGCVVVVTTRTVFTGLIAGEGAHPLTLDLLSAVEARELLTRHLGPERVVGDPYAIDEIVRRCAGLPLALALVAARAAAAPALPLAALTAELRDSAALLDVGDDDDPTSDVRAVFSWSYRALSEPAARLFRLIGLHPGPDLSTAAAASLAGAPQSLVRAWLTEVARAHLVVEHVPGRYTVHDLLRAYAVEQADTHERDDERREAVRRLLDHYVHSAHTAALALEPGRDPIVVTPHRPGVSPERPASRVEATVWFEAEWPVLIAAVDQAAATGLDAHTWQLAWGLGDFLYRRGHWREYATMQQAAIAAAARLADPLTQSRTLRCLARANLQMGRYHDAETELRQAVELSIQAGDLTGQGRAWVNLGMVADRQGRYPEALEHARRALKVFRAAHQRGGEAHALNSVGWYHARLGHHRQALAACRRALALHEEVGNQFGQGTAWDSLGYAHHNLGQYAEAEACYQRSLDVSRHLGDRYNEAEVLIHLGDTHHAAGDPAAARAAWQAAVVILDQLGHGRADQVRASIRSLDLPSARDDDGEPVAKKA